MAPGPEPGGRAGSQQHPARSFPFGSRRGSFPARPPRLRAPPPSPGPALNFPAGRRRGAATLQPGSFFHPLSQSSGRAHGPQANHLREAPQGARAGPAAQRGARLPRAGGGAPRPPPSAPTPFLSNLQQSWPRVAAAAEAPALSGAAHLVASARPRAGTGSAARLPGPAGPHGVAGQVPPASHSPLVLLAPRPAGRRGLDPSARGHARERRRSFLQLGNPSRLSPAAGLGARRSRAVTPGHGSELPRLRQPTPSEQRSEYPG